MIDSTTPCGCPVCGRSPQAYTDRFMGLFILGYVVKCSRDFGDRSSCSLHTVMVVDFENIESAIARWNAMYAKKVPQA